MFSWPPATTISLSPQAMVWAASMTDLRPEPHTALMVSAGVSWATPAFIMAWRAGFWPTPAASTWPMMTSPIWSACRPARAMASRITMLPSSVAGVLASAPPNLPTAVRAAETMTMSSMVIPSCCDFKKNGPAACSRTDGEGTKKLCRCYVSTIHSAFAASATQKTGANQSRAPAQGPPRRAGSVPLPAARSARERGGKERKRHRGVFRWISGLLLHVAARAPARWLETGCPCRSPWAQPPACRRGIGATRTSRSTSFRGAPARHRARRPASWAACRRRGSSGCACPWRRVDDAAMWPEAPMTKRFLPGSTWVEAVGSVDGHDVVFARAIDVHRQLQARQVILLAAHGELAGLDQVVFRGKSCAGTRRRTARAGWCCRCSSRADRTVEASPPLR